MKTLTLFLFSLLCATTTSFAQQAGSLDTTFIPGTGANGLVHSIALQPDGKVLIGGELTEYNGRARNRIARLNTDGSLDTTFDPGTGATGANSVVYSIAVQPDGKVLIGGWFTEYNGTARSGIARLNADGSLDTSFDPGTGIDTNRVVYSITLQPDGKVLIGGGFTSYNGTARNSIARLNADGSLDTSFDPGTGASGSVYSTAQQPDGKVLIGGSFNSYNGTARNYIARLNTDGSLDASFDPSSGADYWVESITLQPDGKVLIGGGFTSYNGTARNRIARLNADGSLDTGFDPGTGLVGVNEDVLSIALQPDGKVLIGGWFTEYNGTERNNIARLNVDGSLDTNFAPGSGAINLVYSIVLQPDGKVMIGGTFISYNGTSRNRIARVHGGLVATANAKKVSGQITAGTACIDKNQALPNTLVQYQQNGKIGMAISGDSGQYSYGISDTGRLTIAPIIPKWKSDVTNFTVHCPDSGHYDLHLKEKLTKDTTGFDFVVDAKLCHFLTVNISANRRRRCFKNNTFVRYCNDGMADAPDGLIKVIWPEFTVPLSSSPAWSKKDGDTLFYDLGTVGVGQCGTIRIVDSVLCGLEDDDRGIGRLGLAQCTRAEIYPINDCSEPDPGHDGSSVLLKAKCRRERSAQFEIKNTGKAMTDSAAYRFYLDSMIVMEGKYMLEAGKSKVFDVPSAGQTVRLEADLTPGHPHWSSRNVILEGCKQSNGNVVSKGHVTPRKPDDEAIFVDVSCERIRGSYDPNDKQAFPVGITQNNYIQTSTKEIDMKIRFQNTGTDTAFTVRIIDTLDSDWDIETFRMGAASHTYELELQGTADQPILIWTFNNIQLPDSATDETGSNGFVHFHIGPKEPVTTKMTVENFADIYFDFNPPIRTNTVRRVFFDTTFTAPNPGIIAVGNVSLEDELSQSIDLYPNPGHNSLQVDWDADTKINRVQILNSLGQTVFIEDAPQSQGILNVRGLASGMYRVLLHSDQGVVGRAWVKD